MRWEFRGITGAGNGAREAGACISTYLNVMKSTTPLFFISKWQFRKFCCTIVVKGIRLTMIRMWTVELKSGKKLPDYIHTSRSGEFLIRHTGPNSQVRLHKIAA
jgi:hypothetical protein